MQSSIKNKTIVQNAYVVNDLRQAIERWSTTLGLGPFFVLENITLDCMSRGKPTAIDVSAAFVQSGSLNIELLQQLNDAPSMIRDVYRSGEEGFHHVCIFTDNYDDEVERYRKAGCELALEQDLGAYRTGFINAVNTLGYMIELVDDVPEMRATYKKVKQAAEAWDGTNLIRPLF